MTTEAEKEAGISVQRTSRGARVTNGPPCPGSVARGEGAVECDRVAIAVVEDRSLYKCAYGHRWRRLT